MVTMTRKMSSICKDFVTAQINSQIHTLQCILKDLEDNQNADKEFTVESLRQAEFNLRNIIRKLCVNNDN